MTKSNDPDAIIEAFIDDSGNTGDDLGHAEQRNMLLACLVVPYTRAPAFWARADAAWRIASSVTMASGEVELKGKDIFGSRGAFERVSRADCCRILDAVVDALIAERIYIFWEGLPKHLWSEITADLPSSLKNASFWQTFLLTFCTEAYQVFDRLYGPHDFRITADENSWIPTDHVLSLRGGWPRLLNQGIIFRRSIDVRGLQVVDLVVHALYRRNKTSCPSPDMPPVTLSDRDRLATTYVQRLAEAGLVFPLTQAATELAARADSRDDPGKADEPSNMALNGRPRTAARGLTPRR